MNQRRGVAVGEDNCISDIDRMHAVIQFRCAVSFPRFSMAKGERWSFVVYGKHRERLAALKEGRRFEFAGGLCLAEDVDLIYEGPCCEAYSRAAGYIR